MQQPFLIDVPAGIQRDGTELDAKSYTDGTWTRMQRGRPRKMGGYKTASQNLTGIPRALHSQTANGFQYIHSGFNNGIEQVTIDNSGFASVPATRTPGGFTNSANNIWQLDSYFDPISQQQQILAFVIPGLSDIGYGATQGNLYAGPIYSTTALTSVSGLLPQATGGVVVLPPYTVVYGSNGFVQWSVPLQPLDFVDLGSGAANVTGQKIVRGLPLRGGGSFSPGALLWSIDSVIRMYFVGNPAVFAFDTITAKSSILSHNSVVDVDGIYYWAGVDRFMRYNGYVQEIPNDKNINFFFDNINRPFAQKAYAVRNSRWGEIWFCAPLFGATECNWAAIYNYRENIWYDTKLPNSGRSFGIQNNNSPGMVMSGIDLYNATSYRLWLHEVGHDEVDGGQVNAIYSSFTTPVMTPATFQQPLDKGLHIDAIEPDFVQNQAMSVSVFTRGNARSPYAQSGPFKINQSATSALDQQIPLRSTGKQMKLKFESNSAGADYQGGKIIAYVEIDQGRRTQ